MYYAPLAPWRALVHSCRMQRLEQHPVPDNRFPVSDPRPGLLLAVLFGVLVWQVPPLGLIPVAIGVACTLALPSMRRRRKPGMLGGLLRFCLLWGVLKFAADMTLPGTAPLDAAYAAALLSGRLILLGGIGMALTLKASPRSLGLALAWLLQPVLRRRAWQPALALSLMLHFLPTTQQVVAQVGRSVKLRRPAGGFMRRMLLMPAATLRILGQRTWQQTVAVAIRGLDTPEAWIPRFAPAPKAWIQAGILALAGLSLLLLPSL